MTATTRRLRVVLMLAGIALLASLVGSGLAADTPDHWPRFRGPNGTGTAPEQDIPVRWTDRDILWKVPVPGSGNSSPVVWGDRLFLQSAGPDGQGRSLLCYNALDGKLLWSRESPGKKAHTNSRNSLASSTPAVDGERVYCLFWDGNHVGLHGFDRDGKPLWQYDLGPYLSQHGAGNSPIAHAGKVYLLHDHDQGAAVIALDARTGKKVWETARKHYRACYSTPFILERPGRTPELIVSSTQGLVAYDLDTGREVWRWDWSFDGMALRTVSSPIHHDGVIIATSGDGKGDRHMVAVKPGDKGDVSATNLAWQMKKPRATPYVPCPVGRDEHLYWVNDNGIAGCQVAKTGAMVWNERLGGDVTASPVLIGDKMVVITEAGDVYVLAAEPKFRLLAKNTLGEGAMATPAVANGRLYVRGNKHLFCIGKP